MVKQQLSFEELDIFDVAEHFGRYIPIPQNSECWEWQGPFRNEKPFYPPLNKRAQIVAYELRNNIELPPYTRISTVCGNPFCVNPTHFADPIILNISKKHRVPLGDQPNKRAIQKEQNYRLIEYMNKNPDLYGDIIILPGIKYVEATEPYLSHNIAKNILLCEEQFHTYLAIKESLKLEPELNARLRLYSQNIDILDIIPILTHKGKWTGFDLDFSGTITGKRWNKLTKAINAILMSQEIFWLRVSVTVRPNSPIVTRNSLNNLLKYLICCDFLVIEDLATGPVYAYCDTAPMQTMQVICKRREHNGKTGENF